VLAIHPGALGDVLLAVPALRALRARGPAPLALAAQPRIAALLAALGAVDRALAFDSLGLDRLFVAGGEAARAAHWLADAASVVCWFGARDPVFARRLREIAPAAVIDSPRGEGPCVWEHLLGTVTGAGARRAGSTAESGPPGPDGGGLRGPMAVAPALRAVGRAALTGLGWDGRTPMLLVHPGAGGVAKRWPVEGFARVVEAVAGQRDLVVAIHEGPADADAVQGLAERLRPHLECSLLRLQPPDLSTLAGALRHVAAWVGNDSGVSHLAAAVGAPAVILFAPANLAWRPWAPAARTCVVATSAPAEADVAAVTSAVEAILP
jgi:ADP-heptose:LPS heptosyltransferase